MGTHVLHTLLKNGRQVRALKRNSSDLDLVRDVFNHYGNDGDALFQQIEWVDGDVADIFSLIDALGGIEDIYHCAALVSFEKKDADRLMKINSEGTANLVNAALDANIRKFGHVSSTAAVGKTVSGKNITERSLWKTSKHNSNYSISKYNAEREVWRGTQEGLDAVIVNPSIVVGPGDWNRSSSAVFKTISKGLKYYPTGSNGFVDVRDISEALYQLMQSEITGERYLLISENATFQHFFETVAKHMEVKAPSRRASKFHTGFAWRMLALRRFLTGKPSPLTKESHRSAHQLNEYNTDKIKEAIGFEFHALDAAVANAASFFRKLH